MSAKGTLSSRRVLVQRRIPCSSYEITDNNCLTNLYQARSLCILHRVPAQLAERAIEAAAGASELACWVDDLTPSLLLAISTLHLRRLSIEVNHFLWLPNVVSLSCRWFKRLTHLELVFWAHSILPIFSDDSFSSLTRLTSMSLSLGGIRPDSMQLDEYCASLAEKLHHNCPHFRVLSITVASPADDLASVLPATRAFQTRYQVPVVFLRPGELLEGWSWSGTTAWDRAEAEVLQRSTSKVSDLGSSFISIPLYFPH